MLSDSLQYNIRIFLVMVIVMLCITYPDLLYADNISMGSGSEGDNPFQKSSDKLVTLVNWLIKYIVPSFGVAALALNILFLYLGRFSGRYFIYSVIGAIATGIIPKVWEWLSGTSAAAAGIAIGAGG